MIDLLFKRIREDEAIGAKSAGAGTAEFGLKWPGAG
jgi:hypothetical protein